ncbi:hypothetical protein [Bacillus sp. JCM 19041]|uniref:hypothetical protein n=1 Tax=Bacillus sp. JCM 19041 TaxID=1460637 RepID=UPI0006D125CE
MKKEADRLMNVLKEQIKEQLEFECSSYLFCVQALIYEYHDSFTVSEQRILQRTTKIYRQLKRGYQVKRVDIEQLNIALVVIRRRFVIKSFV